jgi:Metallo-peptidase family M12
MLPLFQSRIQKPVETGASPRVTGGSSLISSRCIRSKTVRVILTVVALAASGRAVAATIGSPLHFPRRSDAAVRRAAVAGERLLDVDARAFADLRAIGRGEAVRIEAFPFAPDATGDLLLERFEVATSDARILVQTPRGAELLPMPSVAHFRGRLDGDQDSRVYLGVQPGFLVAILRTSAGVVYVGPEGPADGPVQHVLRRADSPLNDEFVPSDWRCDADDLPQAPIGDVASIGEPSLRPFSAASALETSALKEATVSIETDQELLAKYSGNVSAMTAYITTLLGAASVIYERDVQVHLNVNLIQAWTTTDPYSSTSTRTQLDEVGDWWHANRPKTSYPRTTVHYMSGKPVSGGIAWLDVLCMSDFSQGGHWGGAYGVTQVNAAYPSSPWDLLAVTHELGHNFGSPHTHCYSPPIDMCYNAETGCYSGPIVNPGPLGGTIMSYCHLLSGGYGNIDMRFHERCISEQMLPEINSVACLTDYSGGGTPAASRFYTVAPCRVLDTRNAVGPYGGPALAASSDRTFTLSGQCGIPSTAKAVSVNLTVAQPTAGGDLRLYAAGAAVPMASAINYRAGQTRANNATTPLGTGGGLAVRCDQSSGSVQAIIDVNGYYQ